MSKPGDAFRYVYDLGDHFVHLVTLEAIVPGDNTFELIDGAFAEPPEDSCGSPGKGNMGYQQLLRLVKERGADIMTASLLEAAHACNIKCFQRDSHGRLAPFHFEPRAHTLAMHAALAEPLGIRTGTMPNLQGFTMAPGGGFATASVAAPFGTDSTAFKPETLELTALCGGCATPYDLKTCSKCKRSKFCSKACLEASWPLHKKECKKIAVAARRK